MSSWEIILVALALAMDALAVSVGLGLSARGSLLKCAARAAAAFGLFQAGMALAGWFAGRMVTGRLGEAGCWVAAAVLAAVGLRMLVEAIRRKPFSREGEGTPPREAGTGWTLLALAVATSLDALGAGLGLAMLGAEIWLAAAVIGLVAAALSAAGVMLAGRLARGASGTLSRTAEIVGALVLLGIAVKIALGGG